MIEYVPKQRISFTMDNATETLYDIAAWNDQQPFNELGFKDYNVYTSYTSSGKIKVMIHFTDPTTCMLFLLKFSSKINLLYNDFVI